MRFCMTLAAVLLLQMVGAGMAAGTGRNGFHLMGRMFDVTVKAGDLGSMFAAFALDFRSS